ncbi:MTH1187 family thiamine-binding protein [Candidatus Methanocrinis natronophilus]|uniref:MTH1187 family thiamine-binding protein n=1 Tax=Candidatus Methanocrinis natronophilus TaxID=3033396 RepID=A0ABT5X6C1_9EURY|nr:MTH1187 family thiamine-binding protein [Candidatus Methanocrinis natronophilus]MDF0590231.1 MTH1187 family thiamine-binding protein [Candidatus Methanocrinis natronophilus]
MIVAELSMITMGTGTSASRYVRAVHQVLKDSGLKFVPGPMSTSVEAGSMGEIFEVVEKADAVLAEMGAGRIVTTIKIDHRLDKEISIDTKMKAVKE